MENKEFKMEESQWGKSPNEGKLVTLPCDLPSWPKVRSVIEQLQKQKDLCGVFSVLSKLHSTVTEGLSQEDVPLEERNPFKNLQKFFKNVATGDECRTFVEVTVKCIATRALNIEHLKPDKGLEFSTKQKGGKYQMSRCLVASILACSFLCLYDRRKGDKSRGLCPIIFSRFLLALPGLSQSAKLRCVLHYFERIASDMTGPPGNMTFIRQVMAQDKLPTIEIWKNCNKELCPFIVRSEGGIEDAGSHSLQADFANKFIGGGVLSAGKVQEEIRFSVSPELIASMLFMESMDDNEAILIQGFETFSKYSGYASTLHFEGAFHDPAKRDGRGNLETLLCAIDALPRRRMRPHQQYQSTFILREVNKAYVGFSQPEADRISQLVGQRATPLPLMKRQISVSTEDEFHTALESLDQEGLEAVQETLSDFTATLSKGILASALMDASRPGRSRNGHAIPEEGDFAEDGRVNKAEQDDTDGNMSWIGNARRRSSNLSDISSRRSSHSTRNSLCSECSSELEDLHEGFLKFDHKQKHETITEEPVSMAMNDFATKFVEKILQEGYAIASQMNPGVQNFDSRLPSNAAKPRPFRPVRRNSGSSTDEAEESNRVRVVNYVDGLFNNAASQPVYAPAPFRSRSQPPSKPDSAEIQAAALYVEKMFNDVLFGHKGKKRQGRKSPSRDRNSRRNSSPESLERQGSSLAHFACEMSKGIVTKAVSDLASDRGSISSGNGGRVPNSDDDNDEQKLRNANCLASRVMSQALRDVSDAGIASESKKAHGKADSDVEKSSRESCKSTRVDNENLNTPSHMNAKPTDIDVDRLAQNVLSSALSEADEDIQRHNNDKNGAQLLGTSGVGLSPCYELPSPALAEGATCRKNSGDSVQHYAESVVNSILSDAVVDMRNSRPSSSYSDTKTQSVPARKTSSQYFNEEMRRGSIEDDLSLFAEDLARRSSMEDLNKLRRRSSSGFRDITLSNFADELIRSNPNSPSLAMFSSRDRTNSRGSSRRNSADVRLFCNSRKGSLADRTDGDASLDRLSVGTGDSGLADNSRLLSLEKMSPHENILEWLSSKKKNKKPKKKRKRKSKKKKRTSNIDWFVQDLLVDAFHDAFSAIFGEDYLQDFPPAYYKQQPREEQESYVHRFAEQFTESILESAVSLHEEEMELMLPSGDQDMQDCEDRESYEDAVDIPYRLLEDFSDTMAEDIMNETLNCLREIAEAEAQQDGEKVRPIATGNWGCGAFGGDPQLKSLLQWMAATYSDAPAVLYYTFNNSAVDQLEEVCRKISASGWTVGCLMKAILKYQDYSSAALCRGKEEPPSLFHMLLTHEL